MAKRIIDDEWRRKYVGSHAGLWGLYEASPVYVGDYSTLHDWVEENRSVIDEVMKRELKLD